MFEFKADYVLEDERVLLRPLQVADEMYLVDYALKEPDLWRYSLVSAAGEDGMRRYIEGALADRERGYSYPFVVFDKLYGCYAGCTRYYDIQLVFSTLQLGYTWYGSRFQGTGLNRHCKYLLFSFAFEQMGMERVELRADNNNARSIRAMKAVGCVVEGVLRSNMPTAMGGRRDSIVLSVLRAEWEGRVRAMLSAQL